MVLAHRNVRRLKGPCVAHHSASERVRSTVKSGLAGQARTLESRDDSGSSSLWFVSVGRPQWHHRRCGQCRETTTAYRVAGTVRQSLGQCLLLLLPVPRPRLRHWKTIRLRARAVGLVSKTWERGELWKIFGRSPNSVSRESLVLQLCSRESLWQSLLPWLGGICR